MISHEKKTMPEVEYSHVAFADESNWNKGRYRSIALVSASVTDARAFHKDLKVLREYHGKSEFKWKSTKQDHGVALADFFFQRHDRMRVDVLIWDTDDSRHKDVYGRDDKANFARMYYHLLHNVMKRRWTGGERWLICPDVQKEVDWLTLEQCLGWKSWAAEEQLFAQTDEMQGLHEFYNIHEIRPVCSKEFVLVQLADLFAGLAVFSHASFEKYLQWKEEHDDTPSFLQFQDCGMVLEKISNSDKERLPILHHVRQEAGLRNLSVSLESSSGLCTKSPKNPLNFWKYTPQRPSDKAPVKIT